MATFDKIKGINIASNFKLQAETPLDGRLVVDTIADRDALITEHGAYEGMTVYVKADKKKYILTDLSNAVWICEQDTVSELTNDMAALQDDVDGLAERKLETKRVDNLLSSSAVYNFDDGKPLFSVPTINGAEKGTSSVVEDENGCYQAVEVGTGTIGSTSNVYSQFKLGSITENASKITLEFDFEYEHNGRMKLAIADLDVINSLSNSDIRWNTKGIAADIFSNSNNNFQINGKDALRASFFGTWLHAKFVMDFSEKKVEYTITGKDNPADTLEGNVDFRDTDCAKITGIAVYTWLQNDKLYIDNINITALYDARENTRYIVGTGGVYKEYTYVDGVPVLVGRSDAIAAENGAITEPLIAHRAVTTEKIGMKAVGTDELADKSVVTRVIADRAVTGDKLDNGAVTYSKLADGAATNSKIADDSISEMKLREGCVTEEKVHDRAITGDKIAKETITKENIAANAVDGSIIKSQSVDNAHLRSGCVHIGNIADGAVSANKIEGGAVNENHIRDGAVTTDKIASGAVKTIKLADGAVTYGKIANDAVINSKIANDAVTTSKIIDGAVNDHKLADGAVTMSKLAADVLARFNYTTTPQQIGTWIDGKPIYRQVGRGVFDKDDIKEISQYGGKDGSGLSFYGGLDLAKAEIILYLSTVYHITVNNPSVIDDIYPVRCGSYSTDVIVPTTTSAELAAKLTAGVSGYTTIVEYVGKE